MPRSHQPDQQPQQSDAVEIEEGQLAAPDGEPGGSIPPYESLDAPVYVTLAPPPPCSETCPVMRHYRGEAAQGLAMKSKWHRRGDPQREWIAGQMAAQCMAIVASVMESWELQGCDDEYPGTQEITLPGDWYDLNFQRSCPHLPGAVAAAARYAVENYTLRNGQPLTMSEVRERLDG